MTLFTNRQDAGQKLSTYFAEFRGPSVVFAIPGGGVVIGHEIAKFLNAPIDVAITTKLEAPGNPELTIGANGEYINPQLNYERIGMYDINDQFVQEEIERAKSKTEERKSFYRDSRPIEECRGKTAIIVDDGLVSGYTMLAAIRLVEALEPQQIIVAVPLATIEAEEVISDDAKLITLHKPEVLKSLSEYYDEVNMMDELEVKKHLDQVRL